METLMVTAREPGGRAIVKERKENITTRKKEESPDKPKITDDNAYAHACVERIMRAQPPMGSEERRTGEGKEQTGKSTEGAGKEGCADEDQNQ